MGKYYYLTICLSVVLSIVGCNKRNDEFVYIDQSIDNTPLEFTAVNLPTNILYPGRIFICNDKLVLLQHKTDSIFYVFDLINMDYLYSFGSYGPGPNDFLQINTDNLINIGNILKVCDVNNNLKVIDLDKKKIIHKEKLQSDYELFNGFTQIGGTSYAFTNMIDSEWQYVIYNTKDSTTNPVIPYPDWLDENRYKKNPISKIIDCNGFLVSNSEGSKIAQFYGYMNCMRIFGDDWRVCKTCLLGEEDECKPQDDKNMVYYPVCPQNVGNTIYSIYRGYEKEEDILQIWSWDGDLINSKRLGFRITSFCVSDDEERMYAVKALDDGPCQLIIYNLKD